MEIDFMGLNSTTNFDYDDDYNKNKAPAATSDSFGGVETSLSLSTTPSRSNHTTPRGLLCFSEKKKICSAGTEQYSRVLFQRPIFRPSTALGVPYNLNHKSGGLRNISVIKGEPVSLAMAYSGCAPDKAVNSVYPPPYGISDHPRTAIKTGYIPTVAMARKATLARFLEKRLHRMNQAMAAHLMGKPLNATNSHDKIVNDARRSNQSNIIFTR